MDRLVSEMVKNLDTKIALSITISIIIYSIVVPSVISYDPRAWNVAPRDRPPSTQYLFGTTSMGQDVFILTALTLRNSLMLGVLASIILVLVAFTIGATAGATRMGYIRASLTYLIDSFCVIPFLPVLILIGSFWKEAAGIVGTALMIALLSWGVMARNIRSVIMGLRERTFTHTALFSGYGTMKLLFKSYLPYIIRWLTVAFIFGIIFSIGVETTLSVFGITSLENPTIGTLIFWTREYQAYLRGLWWWYTFPLIFLVSILTSLYIVMRHLTTLFVMGEK